MENKKIGTLKFTVEPKALREIVASGRLLEFATTAAAAASSQITAQLVQQVSQGASHPTEGGGAHVEIRYIEMEGGMYGNGGHHPPIVFPHPTTVLLPNPPHPSF
jgi:hypothetical protein